MRECDHTESGMRLVANWDEDEMVDALLVVSQIIYVPMQGMRVVETI